MDFTKYISTVHSTYTESSPLISPLKITKGRITGGWIRLPSGSAGTLHIKVFRGVHQVFPSTPDESYNGDDVLYPLYGNHDVFEPPTELTIHTWNLSTTYDHALIFCAFMDVFKDPREHKDFFARLFGKKKPSVETE